MTKINFIGQPREELVAQFKQLGLPSFRVQQAWNWVYHHGVRDIEDMKNISFEIRKKLTDIYTIERPKISAAQHSTDGTQKWLLKFSDSQEVEAVHIPEVDRGTLCISSQVGCTLTCSFCHTGTQMLVRNLTASEIVNQIITARDVFNEWPTPISNRFVSNIVMMGMGEPLYNYDEVSKALKIIMDEKGLSISKRKITLSTSGVVPMMEKCGKELGVNLAVSLHAVSDDIRNILVPLNKKYPLKELLDACRYYPTLTNARRITFEYVMLKDVNDSESDARELVKIIKGIPAKINLIPFNPWPNSPYECSSQNAISRFAEIVYKAGYPSPIRTPRGRDILAACGQLKSESKRIRKSELKLAV